MNTFKPNYQQHPIDIARDYEKWDAEQNAPEAIPDKPEEVSLRMVKRGVMDPRTGLLTGNSKQNHILTRNITGYTQVGKENYERIFGHP